MAGGQARCRIANGKIPARPTTGPISFADESVVVASGARRADTHDTSYVPEGARRALPGPCSQGGPQPVSANLTRPEGRGTTDDQTPEAPWPFGRLYW